MKADCVKNEKDGVNNRHILHGNDHTDETG